MEAWQPCSKRGLSGEGFVATRVARFFLCTVVRGNGRRGLGLARVILALRGSIVAGSTEVIGDAEDWVTAEDGEGGDEASCNVGV